MLDRISSDKIELIAEDVTECASYLKKKVMKILNKDDDNSRTAGLARIITVKLGARVMLRRNIDVSLGLVNGTIGTITSIIRSVIDNKIEQIKIILSSGIEHTIERVSVKFEVMDRAFVIRKQFPVCLSYGITIHKSQGLSLKNAVIEAGNSIFSYGQIYVALSRVTTLSGLHLINFDPSSVQANELAIIEYNKLRTQYRPDLMHINILKQHVRKIRDTIWAVLKNVLECQNDNDKDIKDINDSTLWHIRELPNIDKISCYVNVSIQCILHSSIFRKLLLCLEYTNIIRQFIDSYVSNDKTINTMAIRQLAGHKYLENIQQDVSEFIIDLINNIDNIKSVVEHKLNITSRCKVCNYTNTKSHTNYILLLQLPQNLKKTYTLQELMQYNFSCWNNVEKICTNCGAISSLEKTDITVTKSIIILKLLLFKINDGKIIKITDIKIKSVPTQKISIDKNIYKVISGIFHQGKSMIDGHYTSIVRVKDTEWQLINDSKVEKCSWPRNAKDAYIFFAEKI